MFKTISTWKKCSLIVSQAMFLGFSGSCLPDNTFANTAGDIVSGIITAGVNVLIASSNLQV